MKKLLLPLITSLAISAPLSSLAAVIDFQSLEHFDTSTTYHGKTYTEDGFQIESTIGGFLATLGTEKSNYSDSTAMFHGTNSGVTELTRLGGGIFDLFSIDLAELNGGGASEVIFTRDGGHSQSFLLDGVAFGAETFLFDSGFLGSSSVTWVQEDLFHQFDNINVSPSAVPVPAAVWLFGSGLIGLFGMRKKS